MHKNINLFALLFLITFSTSQDLLAMQDRQIVYGLEKNEDTRANKQEHEKRTLKQTWSKVVRLKWSDLDKKDAWNIFLTTATVGGVVGGSYIIYRSIFNDLRIPLDPSIEVTPDIEYNLNIYEHLQLRSDYKLNCTLRDKRLCATCYENFVPLMRYRFDCWHTDTCGDCLRAYVRVQANQGNIAYIRCPHIESDGNQCSHYITPSEIRQLAIDSEADRDIISHAEQAIINSQRLSLLTTVRHLKVCHLCDGFFIYRGRNMIHCPNCDGEYCAHCRADRTECNGEVYRCANARYGSRNNAVFKMCPRCTQPIQRTSGCNHMTCERCNYQFCWTCLEPSDGFSTPCQSFSCATLPYANVR